MALDPITGLEQLAETVVNSVAGAHAADTQAQTDLAKGQQTIDANEAENTNWFVAGWRPAVGWVGAIALALIYWPKAIILTFLYVWQYYIVIHAAADPSAVHLPTFPDLGVGDLIGLLTSMLGLTVMRTLEKVKGVAR